MSPSSPLESALLFELGPMRVSTAVAVTWLLMLVLATGSWLLTRGLEDT